MKVRSVLPAIIGLGVVAALAACGPDYAADKASGTAGGGAAPAPVAATTAPAQPAAVPVKVLTVSTVDGLAPIVTNDKGRTIYRFDQDSNNPAKTTCVGQCAITWEPVLAPDGFDIKGGGIDKNLVGEIIRPDGGKQLTLKNWPLYYFKDDKTLGQLAGQGKGGTWFAIAPDGSKAKATAQSGGQAGGGTANSGTSNSGSGGYGY
jgi:predicted lipoprotein with Yx(FWY)xxD motif